MTLDPTTAYDTPPQPRQQQEPPGETASMTPAPDHGEKSYRGSGRLLGRAALITGGDSGIGRAVAIAFPREGADVLVAYLSGDEGSEPRAGREAPPCMSRTTRSTDFEGQIAKGQYGGGEVIVWDRGRWEPEGDPVRGLKKGRLDFTLEGVKLKGRWHLVRMGGKPGEKRENWPLIKGSDDAARSAADPDILEEAPESVISGRTVEDIGSWRTSPSSRRSGEGARSGRSPRRPAVASRS